MRCSTHRNDGWQDYLESMEDAEYDELDSDEDEEETPWNEEESSVETNLQRLEKITKALPPTWEKPGWKPDEKPSTTVSDCLAEMKRLDKMFSDHINEGK